MFVVLEAKQQDNRVQLRRRKRLARREVIASDLKIVKLLPRAMGSSAPDESLGHR